MRIATRLTGSVLLLALLLTAGCFQPRSKHRRAVVRYVTAASLRNAAFDEDAIFQLQQAVSLDPDFALAHSALGDLYQQHGRYDQAATAYENACRLDPWAFNDHFNLGSVYKILERFADAIRTFKRACQLQPDNSQANYQLGICYYQTEDYTQAAIFCARAAELAPDDSQILASLGDIYNKTGQDYKAVNAYKQALELDLSDHYAMINLGMVYLRMKRFSPAQAILDRAINTAPGDPNTHIAMAYCQLSEKNLALALDHYRRALALNANSHQALNGIGVTYMMYYLSDRSNAQVARDALNSWHRSLELIPNQPKIKRLLTRYTAQLNAAAPSVGPAP